MSETPSCYGFHWTYDAEADALYARFRDVPFPEGGSVRQVEVGNAVIDLDDDGRVVGIEVLRPFD